MTTSPHLKYVVEKPAFLYNVLQSSTYSSRHTNVSYGFQFAGFFTRCYSAIIHIQFQAHECIVWFPVGRFLYNVLQYNHPHRVPGTRMYLMVFSFFWFLAFPFLSMFLNFPKYL